MLGARLNSITQIMLQIAALSIFAVATFASSHAAENANFDGQWRTTAGIVKLKQADNNVTGTYGNADQFTLEGTADGRKLTFKYQEGKLSGSANWTLDKSGHSFTGSFQIRGGQAGNWLGWRPDPDAAKDKQANVSGLWLTDLGLMELEQTGDKVKGTFALGGVSTIEGKITGRRFDFKHKTFRSGKGWFDFSADGKTFAGAAATNGFASWSGWKGRRAPEFARHAKLSAGKIVDGSTNGLLTYSVRAPAGYKAADGKKWPAIVILHGSNMSGKAYVNTIAAAWPDIAKDYLLIGINGERPSAIGEQPAFNFSYVSYVGRSKFKGYPGTDRESPALVAEALDELREAYPISHYFVGGHSQGGFLTYSLLMNFPEKIAGALPISAGVIFQCEPGAYDHAKVRAAQRLVPLAIIHGKQDNIVGFDSGEYAATIFGEANWPAFRFFADDSGAGHMFGRLPVDQAIRWLESQTSNDPTTLVDFAEERIKASGYRDAIAALNRARDLNPKNADVKARLERLSKDVDDRAAARAKEFLPKIEAGWDQAWIDTFLAYRDDFEFAPAASEVMKKFAKIRAEHGGPAEKAFGEANALFQQGKRDEGYAKYQEIVDRFFAAPSYRNVKRWLADRK
jgi:predicted esterase